MVIETVLTVAGAALLGSTGREAAKRVFKAFENRVPIARDITDDIESSSTFGERLADRVASVGGSWGFVSAFGVFLLAWALLNMALLPTHDRFDPYPFIFLNLLLSMLAAIQAPIIMMSQNRHSARDRIDAQHDFEVNLKAELEILAVHEKLDQMHADHSAQLAALRTLLEEMRNIEPDGNASTAQ